MTYYVSSGTLNSTHSLKRFPDHQLDFQGTVGREGERENGKEGGDEKRREGMEGP